MRKQVKIIIEKHPDGYVAYPVGLKGVVAAQSDTYEEALADVNSAIECHIESLWPRCLELDEMAQEISIAVADVKKMSKFSLFNFPLCRIIPC